MRLPSRRVVLIEVGVLAAGVIVGGSILAFGRHSGPENIPPRNDPSPSDRPLPFQTPLDSKTPHLGWAGGISFDEAHGYIIAVTNESTGDMQAGFFTWKWDGSAWHLLGSAPPEPASNPVYDPAISKTIILTGCATGCPLETWAWDGSTWSDLPATSNPPSTGEINLLAFDRARNNVLLYRSTWSRSTTWTFDGQGWTQVSGASPPPRLGASMAYDPRTSTVLLYGGMYDVFPSFGQRNDTWAWDGTTWAELHSLNGPGAAQAALAYDAHGGTIILMQLHIVRAGSAVMELSSWSWNGSDWTQLHPSHLQTIFDAVRLVYDQRHQQLVLLGTLGNQSSTWTYADGQWRQAQ
jgi:hypothetical protein